MLEKVVSAFMFPGARSRSTQDLVNVFYLPIPELNRTAPVWFCSCENGSPYIILYAHTNGTDIARIACDLEYICHSTGCHIVAPEYPGYGTFSGESDANVINTIFLTTFQFLVAKHGWPASNIVLWGASIGSGVIIRLLQTLISGGVPTAPTSHDENVFEWRNLFFGGSSALTYKANDSSIGCSTIDHIGAVILQASFSSIKDAAVKMCSFVVKAILPANLYDNEKTISKIVNRHNLTTPNPIPIAWFHGKDDTLFSPTDIINLHNAYYGPKALYLYDKVDHNCYNFKSLTRDVLSFIKQHVHHHPVSVKLPGALLKLFYATVPMSPLPLTRMSHLRPGTTSCVKGYMMVMEGVKIKLDDDDSYSAQYRPEEKRQWRYLQDKYRHNKPLIITHISNEYHEEVLANISCCFLYHGISNQLLMYEVSHTITFKNTGRVELVEHTSDELPITFRGRNDDVTLSEYCKIKRLLYYERLSSAPMFADYENVTPRVRRLFVCVERKSVGQKSELSLYHKLVHSEPVSPSPNVKELSCGYAVNVTPAQNNRDHLLRIISTSDSLYYIHAKKRLLSAFENLLTCSYRPICNGLLFPVAFTGMLRVLIPALPSIYLVSSCATLCIAAIIIDTIEIKFVKGELQTRLVENPAGVYAEYDPNHYWIVPIVLKSISKKSRYALIHALFHIIAMNKMYYKSRNVRNQDYCNPHMILLSSLDGSLNKIIASTKTPLKSYNFPMYNRFIFGAIDVLSRFIPIEKWILFALPANLAFSNAYYHFFMAFNHVDEKVVFYKFVRDMVYSNTGLRREVRALFKLVVTKKLKKLLTDSKSNEDLTSVFRTQDSEENLATSSLAAWQIYLNCLVFSPDPTILPYKCTDHGTHWTIYESLVPITCDNPTIVNDLTSYCPAQYDENNIQKINQKIITYVKPDYLAMLLLEILDDGELQSLITSALEQQQMPPEDFVQQFNLNLSCRDNQADLSDSDHASFHSSMSLESCLSNHEDEDMLTHCKTFESDSSSLDVKMLASYPEIIDIIKDVDWNICLESIEHVCAAITAATLTIDMYIDYVNTLQQANALNENLSSLLDSIFANEISTRRYTYAFACAALHKSFGSVQSTEVTIVDSNTRDSSTTPRGPLHDALSIVLLAYGST